MGGGAKRRPKNDNRNKRNDTANKNTNRGGRGRSNGIRNSLFVEGGVLVDWNQTTPLQGKNSNANAKSVSKSKSRASSASKTMPHKSYGHTFGYSYPAVKLQTLYVHIPARHSSSFPELELPTLVQSAALVSVGLLYEGSVHPQTMQILLVEGKILLVSWTVWLIGSSTTLVGRKFIMRDPFS